MELGRKNPMDIGRSINETNDSFSFLDDIESAIKFPREFVEVRHQHVLPLSHFYLKLNPEHFKTAETGSIHSLTTLFMKYIEIDDILQDHLRLQAGTLGREDSESEIARETLDARLAAIIRPCSTMKSMIASYITLLNWNIPIHILFEKATGGNEVAFLRLAQVDKSILTVDPFASGLIDKQLIGDWGFFEALGKAISAHPLNARAEIPKAVAIVAHLWDQGFSEMKFREIVTLLREHKILPNASDYDYFRKQLYKFGLKKSRYNKK